MVVVTWIFFRAGSLSTVREVFASILSMTSSDFLAGVSHPDALWGFLLIALLEALQWLHRRKHFLQRLAPIPTPVRWGLWYAMGSLILIFGRFGNEQFLYFQF